MSNFVHLMCIQAVNLLQIRCNNEILSVFTLCSATNVKWQGVDTALMAQKYILYKNHIK